MTAYQSPMPYFMDGLRGKLLVNEPMSRHTSWRTGGAADYLYIPADKQDLIRLLKQISADIDLHWVGLGSNLLVRDGGVRGMVLKTSKGLNEIQIHDGRMLYAESGVSSARVARISARNGLSGVEFLAGVPGSFGGALTMNAGAFGGETWDWVDSIECVNRSGDICHLSAGEVNYSYRSVDLPEDCWILSGELRLEVSNSNQDGREKIRSLLDKRSHSQPVQSANAGSVFRNPEGDFAARLIEQAGMKGAVIGDAIVSEVHANFIINRGKATSSDIEELIEDVKEKVLSTSGIALKPEVRILGEQK